MKGHSRYIVDKFPAAEYITHPQELLSLAIRQRLTFIPIIYIYIGSSICIARIRAYIVYTYRRKPNVQVSFAIKGHEISCKAVSVRDCKQRKSTSVLLIGVPRTCKKCIVGRFDMSPRSIRD